MEFEYLSSSSSSSSSLFSNLLAIIIILVPITLVFLINKHLIITNKKTKTKLPPGPWKLPIIGNIHQLALGGSSSSPHKTLTRLSHKHGPLMHLQLGQVSTVVVSSPDTAKQIMRLHDLSFASRPQIIATRILSYDSKGLVFAPYGEYWRQLRKLCILELLSTKRVQSFHSIRDEEFSGMVHWIGSNSGSKINLTERIISASFNVISRAAFGKYNSEDHQVFVSVIKQVVTLAGGFDIADLYPSVEFLHYVSGIKPKLLRLREKVDFILEKIIQRHIDDHAKNSSSMEEEEEEEEMKKKNGYEDLVDVLLRFLGKQQEAGFSFTTENVKAVLLDIFGAGGETSSTTIDWAMSEMMKNPSVLNKAQDEVRNVLDKNGQVNEENLQKMKYLKAVIKETLRLHPPVPLLLPRECRQPCTINGYEIPEKTKVIVNAWATGRDPDDWEDPECFKPERFLDSSYDYKGTDFEYIPFGAGRRMCPGISFGLANVEHQLAKILYHFDWELPRGMKSEELDMEEVFGITMRRKDDLYVIPIAYKF